MPSDKGQKFYANECPKCGVIRTYPFDCVGLMDGKIGHSKASSKRFELIPKRDVEEFVGPVEMARQIRAAHDSSRKRVKGKLYSKSSFKYIREFLSREAGFIPSDEILKGLIKEAMEAPKIAKNKSASQKNREAESLEQKIAA